MTIMFPLLYRMLQALRMHEPSYSIDNRKKGEKTHRTDAIKLPGIGATSWYVDLLTFHRGKYFGVELKFQIPSI